MTILVVEDNQINMVLLRSMLEKAGYSYTCAFSGEEAVEKAASSEFDIILMDIDLPGIDGVEAFKQIGNRKKATGGSLPPTIALTAYSEDEEKERFIEKGFAGFISKPVDYEKLIEILKDLL
ncbi:MAG: response regulator [bacterium]|nr:response regulator [bacterium]